MGILREFFELPARLLDAQRLKKHRAAAVAVLCCAGLYLLLSTLLYSLLSPKSLILKKNLQLESTAVFLWIAPDSLRSSQELPTVSEHIP